MKKNSVNIYINTIPRSTDPTVRSRRKNYRILSDPMGIRRKLSDVGIRCQRFCRNSSEVVGCRNPMPKILPEFVGSDRILWGSFDLSRQEWERQKLQNLFLKSLFIRRSSSSFHFWIKRIHIFSKNQHIFFVYDLEVNPYDVKI
jgi:hypothetical protein